MYFLHGFEKHSCFAVCSIALEVFSHYLREVMTCFVRIASKLIEPCSTHFFELINQRAGGNPLQCFGVKKRSGRESIRKHDIEMRLPCVVDEKY